MTGKELLTLLQQLPDESLAGEVVFDEYGDEYVVSSITCEISFNKNITYGGHSKEYKIILS